MVILGVCTASLVLPAEFPGRWGELMGDWMMLGAEKYFGGSILYFFVHFACLILLIFE